MTETLYRYDKLVDHKSVICNLCAMVRSGLVINNATHLDLFTPYESIDGIDASVVRYIYNPNIDYEYELQPMDTNPLLLKPSKERAIVEYVLHEKYCDEGVLIEGMKTYLSSFEDMEKLYRVADYFGLGKGLLDHWILEAKEDEEV